MFTSDLDTLSPIFLPNPVNRQHPLARGMVAWWKVLPGRFGGLTWYDLLGKHNGSLLVMAAAGRGFSTATHQGGYGSISFDGTSGSYVSVPSSAEFDFGDMSAFLWVNSSNGTQASKGIVSRWDNAATDNFVLGTNNGGAITFGGTSQTPVAWFGESTAFDGKWHTLGCTRVGTTGSIFFDGISQVSTTNAGVAPGTNGTEKVNIGALADGNFISQFIGNLDDVILINRGLSAAEMAWLDSLARRGFPGLLNRTGRGYAAAAAAGPTVAQMMACLQPQEYGSEYGRTAVLSY